MKETIKVTILDTTGHTELDLDKRSAFKTLGKSLLNGQTVLVWPTLNPALPAAETAVTVHSVKEARALNPVKIMVLHPVAGG